MYICVMTPFKFFEGLSIKQRVFTDWMDAMDDYHLGGIQPPQNNIRWRTAGGLNHPLHTISTSHIRNIMNCLCGTGNMRIPDVYEGRTRNEWYEIFHNELRRRLRNDNTI